MSGACITSNQEDGMLVQKYRDRNGLREVSWYFSSKVSGSGVDVQEWVDSFGWASPS